MNKNYGYFGAAIQAKQGTAATAPGATFYASDDSDGLDAAKEITSINLTKGSPVAVASYVDTIDPSFNVKTLAFPDLVGMLLTAACGADTATADASGDTYTHTIEIADGLPFMTIFEQKGSPDADIEVLEDAKVDSLTITAEGNKPLGLDVTIKGCKEAYKNGTTSIGGTAFDIANGYFDLAGAEVLFSLATDTPVAVPMGITLNKIEVAIKNSVNAKRPMGSAVPNNQVEQGSVVSVTLEGETDSTEQYREVMTGSKMGEDIISKVITGSVQIKFKHSNNDALSLTMKIPAIPWKCDPMGVSTDGGAFALKLSTDGALDTGDGAASFVLVNKSAGYLPAGD